MSTEFQKLKALHRGDNMWSNNLSPRMYAWRPDGSCDGTFRESFQQFLLLKQILVPYIRGDLWKHQQCTSDVFGPELTRGNTSLKPKLASQVSVQSTSSPKIVHDQFIMHTSLTFLFIDETGSETLHEFLKLQ